MNSQSFKEFGIAIGVLILQVVFFRHLKIFGIQPDIILIFIIWYTTKSTRTAAILMAAFLGFSQDALLDLWGLNMFAKTLVVFLAYRWMSSQLDLRAPLPRILSVVFIVVLGHNLLIILLSLFVHNYTAELLFWRHWLGNAIYTTILAGVVQLFRTG